MHCETFVSQGFWNRGTGYASQCERFASPSITLRWLQGTFQLRFHIELHTRKSFRSGLEGMGYKFDMDMGSRISPPISRFLVFFTAYALATDAPAFPNTFSGDRTVSDLSLALISRLSDAQSNIRASFHYCIQHEILFSKG